MGAYGLTREQSVELIVTTALEYGITDGRQIAYMLATAQHESMDFTTCREIDGRNQAVRRHYDGGEDYFGRGYVQTTHERNYAKMDAALGLNGRLIADPDLAATDPQIGAQLLVVGMSRGLYTGVGVGRYIGGDKADYVNARRTVNGIDRADLIAGYASEWELRVQGVIDNVRQEDATYRPLPVGPSTANQSSRRDQQQEFDPLRNIKETRERLQQGTVVFGTPMTGGMPDYLRVNSPSRAPSHHASPDALSDGVLRQGEHSPAVAALQQSLNLLGANDADGRPLKADGIYGRSTREAVEQFQLWSGMPTSGIADRATLDAVRVQAGFAAARQAMGQAPGSHLADNLVPTRPMNPRTSHPGRSEVNPPQSAHAVSGNVPPSAPDRTPDPRDRGASTSAPTIPALQHSLRDFRDPTHPDHSVYAALKDQLPDACENRLVQIAAACHLSGIRKAGQVGRIDVTDSTVFIAPTWPPGAQTRIDITSPSPLLQETIRQVETHDQWQTVQLAQLQAQQQQGEAQTHQGPRMTMG